jgi:hypothetical protein
MWSRSVEPVKPAWRPAGPGPRRRVRGAMGPCVHAPVRPCARAPGRIPMTLPAMNRSAGGRAGRGAAPVRAEARRWRSPLAPRSPSRQGPAAWRHPPRPARRPGRARRRLRAAPGAGNAVARRAGAPRSPDHRTDRLARPRAPTAPRGPGPGDPGEPDGGAGRRPRVAERSRAPARAAPGRPPGPGPHRQRRSLPSAMADRTSAARATVGSRRSGARRTF